ncbi:flagellar hook-associated protein 3 [Geotalea uraniireducens]|uniref:Flagellar hook-associated protein 3 n=1 Tax=Geotalea uraniireducens TaxID=351604 RepID=A0ABM8EQC0_9BACT|nr:flagellar hook-associated protein FlgL [Geotalea uraniireducens]BDV44436.1 flagellar hook-associated protein 3 [Geotalea uraniireducens]
MRVTQNTTANLVLNNLQIIRQRTEELEQQASTGVKVSAPGDDPVTAQQVLHLKALISAGDQYSRNISNGTAWLSMSESAMSELGNVISRAKELGVAMSSDINNPDSQSAAVKELTQLRDELIQLGNTQLNGKYIFGGFKNDTAPFDPAGNYTGTDDAINIEVDRGTQVQINYSGGQLIRGGTPPGSSGTDIIGTINNMITALGAGNTAGVRTELGNLDNAMGQVLATRTDLGARLNHLTAAGNIIDDRKLSLTKVISDKQDVDFAQVISDLTKQQTAYQAAMAASAKVSQMSLLDYLK